MIRCETNGVELLQFELLSEFPNLTHGCFLRLNLNEANGMPNRQKVQAALGIDHLVSAQQCHGKEVWEVRGGAVSGSRKSDALVTTCSNLGLLITHADCQAAIIYDPIHHVVANVHSGWRGSVQNIYAEAIEFLQTKHGSSPVDLLVGISPSLGPQRAEFIHYQTELPEPFWQFQTEPNFFDFWEISRWQFGQCGILPHHIEVAGICNYSNPDIAFSYRLSNTTERLGTVVSLL